MHWKAIWRAAWQRRDFWLRLAGLLLFAVGLSTFAATTQSVEFSVRTSISEHWRGAYDLLVRPPQAIQPTESESGLVEGNYLGVPQGGITRAQYEEIAGLPGVEVAAPVATLGYVLNATGDVTVIGPPPEEGRLYRWTIRLSGPAPEFNRQWETFWKIQYPDQPDVIAQMQITGAQPMTMAGLAGRPLFSDIAQLPRQWTLLAGIDPAQEARLVGLPDTIVTGNYLPLAPGLKKTMDMFQPDQPPLPQIPIIISKNAFLGDTRVDVRLEAIPAPDFDLTDDVAAARAYAQNKPAEVILEHSIPLDGNLSPLSGNAIWVEIGKEPEIGELGGIGYLDFGTLLYPGGAAYETLPEAPAGAAYANVFRVKPLGSWGEQILPLLKVGQTDDPGFARYIQTHKVGVLPEAPLFRPLEVRSLPPFRFKVYGRYDFLSLAAPQDPLAYVPLGIYEPPQAVLRYDEDGQPLPGQIYTPDLNPGGFIPRPPLALTTLDAIEYLSGREDFIDAIRVRVAGIDAYTPENLARVEALAAEIVERTGLHVDVVAGSSPQKVLVQVPGTGYLEEPWTTLGAAVEVSQGMTTANSILLLALLVASVLFIAETSQVSLLGRYPEIGTLRAMGWSAAQTLRYLLLDALAMASLAGVLGMLASLALNLAAGLRITGGILAGVFLIGVSAYLIGAALPAWQVTRRWPVALLQQGEMDFPKARPQASRSLHLAALAARQAWMRRARFLMTAFIVALGMALGVFLAGVLLALQGRLQITLLGTFISMHVRSYHFLMALIVLGMSFLAVLGNLLLSVNERASEFALLLATGWQRKHINRLVVLEALWTVLAGAFPGALLSLAVLRLLLPESDPAILALFPAAMLLAVGLAALAAWYPLRQLTRLMPAHVLSAEGRRIEDDRPVSALARVVPLSLALATMLLITMLLGGRNALTRSGPTAAVTPTPTLPPVQAQAPVEEAMQHLTALSEPGSRDIFANERQAAAADYIAQTLAEIPGWQVARETFPLPRLDLTGVNGDLYWPDGTAEIVSMAVHFDELESGQAVSGPVRWIAGETPQPLDEPLDGYIVLLLAPPESIPGQTLLEFVRQEGASRALAVLEIRTQEAKPPLAEQLEALHIEQASLYTGDHVIATLPGTSDRAPLWLAAPYVSREESPGANLGASGSAALLAWAQMLAQDPPDRTVQLVFLGGDSRPFGVGPIAFLKRHAAEKPAAVLYFDALSNWDTLVYTSRLDALDAAEMFSADDLETYLTAGQSDMADAWLSLLNLDDPDLLTHIADWQAQDVYGLGQTPDFLVDLASRSSQESGVPAEPRYISTCDAVMLFLMADHPAMSVCSAMEMETLNGSMFDTPDTIDRPLYRQALGFGYQLIQNLLTSELP